MDITHVPMYALTGGPGGGKSTSKESLTAVLTNHGVLPFFIPEAATILFGSGVQIETIGSLEFQRQILRRQLWEEQYFRELAAMHRGKRIIFADRGCLDGRAYVNGNIAYFEREVAQHVDPNLTVDAMMARYENVFHIQSPAVDAPEVYDGIRHNNPARQETAQEAAARDRATLNAWLGHEHMHIISNRHNSQNIDFPTKMKKLHQAVFYAMGIPQPIEREHKFLVSEVQLSMLSEAVAVQITQHYLMSEPGVERRVRARNYIGTTTDQAIYFYTEKRDYAPGERYELEYAIDAAEYRLLLQTADPTLKPIQKKRLSFAWDGRYYQLDFFEDMRLAILEVELSEANDTVDIPPFIRITKDVTDNKDYRNYAIAAGQCPCYA